MKKESFFEFLLSDPSYLSNRFISIDLLPGLKDDVPYNDRVYMLLDVDNIDDIINSGYNIEIRENRYLTILVSETTTIKEDIKVYLRNKRLNSIIDEEEI